MSVSLQLKSEMCRASESLVALHDPHSSRAADLRRVAQTLALRWFNGSTGSTALSIISADRGEGRSTVAANLACIFARSGMSVLLIDADTHDPSLHHVFDLAAPETVRGSGQRIAGFANLCVVPASEIESRDAVQFMNRPIQALIERRRGEFAAIFVDTPAACVSNDYLVAGLASGGALAVTREGVTRARLATRMLDECDDAGIPVVGGVMLNA
ncbi:P-loop NTPase [Novosphingobium resinovorum]|uniref:P-loop NTPase n=1 Tax=Novosphingobium resinovorum TaxID=158500 RepID=UPI002ED00F6D|nr:P-loop NTPase [Novosphingobium resinovorum]